MVCVLSRGEHGRAAPSERLVGLEGIRVGLSKVLLSPSTLPDPFTGDRGLPRVRGPGQALVAMPLGPQECIGVGMVGDSRHVLVPPYHHGIICRVHVGRGVVDARVDATGTRLLGSFAMSTIMAASRESR